MKDTIACYAPAPNFFIVGAGKCGTTSLYEYLRQHPDVFMPDRKELHFFSTDLERPNRISEEEYFGLFQGAEGKKCIGEASADYLYSRAACDRIKNVYPNARIIIALRNPIDKVYSTHGYAVWRGREKVENFEDALAMDRQYSGRTRHRRRNYTDGAKYAEYVRMYLENFGKNQVHIIIFEEMVRDTEGVYRELCSFLGIRNDVEIEFGRHNARRKPRFKKMSLLLIPSSKAVQVGKRVLGRRRMLGSLVRSAREWNARYEEVAEMRPEVRRSLEGEFAEDVAQLSDLLGMDLTNYWFSRNKHDAVLG
jgi:hypothetical protein